MVLKWTRGKIECGGLAGCLTVNLRESALPQKAWKYLFRRPPQVCMNNGDGVESEVYRCISVIFLASAMILAKSVASRQGL